MQNRGPLYWKILECSAVRLFWIYGLCFFLWPIGFSLRQQMIITSDKRRGCSFLAHFSCLPYSILKVYFWADSNLPKARSGRTGFKLAAHKWLTYAVLRRRPSDEGRDYQCCQMWRLNSSLPFYHPDTVWKFHDFSITQILREINFRDSKSAKSAIFTHFEALNFDSWIFAIYDGWNLPNPQTSESLNWQKQQF